MTKFNINLLLAYIFSLVFHRPSNWYNGYKLPSHTTWDRFRNILTHKLALIAFKPIKTSFCIHICLLESYQNQMFSQSFWLSLQSFWAMRMHISCANTFYAMFYQQWHSGDCLYLNPLNNSAAIWFLKEKLNFLLKVSLFSCFIFHIGFVLSCSLLNGVSLVCVPFALTEIVY